MKPCNIEELVNKIQRAFDKKQAHEERIADRGRFMEASTLAELMVPLEDYATVFEDANILEAIFALEAAQESFQPGRYRHRAVLVLSGSGRVVGKLSQYDIIKSLEPQYYKEVKGRHSALGSFGFSRDFIESVTLQYNDWDRPLQNLYRKAIDQKVKAFMYKPTDGEYIDESATINETIHRLIIGEHHSLLVTKGDDIVGVVRLTDVFDLIHLRLKTLHLAAQIGRTKGGEKAAPST